MARPKKQVVLDSSWENYNRQWQVAVLLPKNARFQKDAKRIQKKYQLPTKSFNLSDTEIENLTTDVMKIVAKVKMPGDYELIILSLLLGEKPLYDGTMREIPKQSKTKQFRVKPYLLKNLLLDYLIKGKKLTYKEAADYLIESGDGKNMNYSDVSKHLALLKKQIDEIYS